MDDLAGAVILTNDILQGFAHLGEVWRTLCQHIQSRLRIRKEGQFRKFVPRVEQITFSGTYAAAQSQRVNFITERAVLSITKEGLLVTEVAPGIELDRDVLGQMAFRPRVSSDLKVMDARIFREGLMGLAQTR